MYLRTTGSVLPAIYIALTILCIREAVQFNPKSVQQNFSQTLILRDSKTIYHVNN